ncbi:MAG TPA: flagellar biosynthesis protein FlgA, partial [Rubrivivax sp.]|nr:flagellar biosynthesis protein FlgA [Rubrivivax sp.]
MTPAHPPTCPRTQRRARSTIATWLWLAALGTAQAAEPDGGLDGETLQRIHQLGEQAGAALALPQVRVEVEPGRLDPRLRLAPCERIEPYLPPLARAWGRSRIGLRCVQGPTPWNVTLPVTVKVFAPAWVPVAPLPAGTVLEAGQLQLAEVDWAAAATPPLADAGQLDGRQLA